MFREITIIGGAGHVGLAFALICAKKNIKVHIHDTNVNSIQLIQTGKLPHKEKNAKKIHDVMKKVLKPLEWKVYEGLFIDFKKESAHIGWTLFIPYKSNLTFGVFSTNLFTKSARSSYFPFLSIPL